MSITVTLSDVTVKPGSLPAVPTNVTTSVSDSAIAALTNMEALEAAIPDDAEYAGLNDAAAQILGGIVYGLVQYLGQGKVPVRVHNYKVSGQLTDGGWVLFVPACGVIMRCNSALSFASQTFEFLPDYVSDVRDKINLDSGFTVRPWDYWESLYASSFDTSLPPRQEFWSMYVKTAEVI